MPNIGVISLLICCWHAAASLAQPPAIFWGSDPIGPNQTAMLAGAHWPIDPVVEIRYPDEAAAVVIEPAQISDASLKVQYLLCLCLLVFAPASRRRWQSRHRTREPFVKLSLLTLNVQVILPSNLSLSVYDVRVCSRNSNSPCSNILQLNRADLWWYHGDLGNASSAGGWLRLFGVNIDFRSYGRHLEAVNGRATLLEEQLRAAVRARDEIRDR